MNKVILAEPDKDGKIKPNNDSGNPLKRSDLSNEELSILVALDRGWGGVKDQNTEQAANGYIKYSSHLTSNFIFSSIYKNNIENAIEKKDFSKVSEMMDWQGAGIFMEELDEQYKATGRPDKKEDDVSRAGYSVAQNLTAESKPLDIVYKTIDILIVNGETQGIFKEDAYKKGGDDPVAQKTSDFVTALEQSASKNKEDILAGLSGDALNILEIAAAASLHKQGKKLEDIKNPETLKAEMKKIAQSLLDEQKDYDAKNPKQSAENSQSPQAIITTLDGQQIPAIISAQNPDGTFTFTDQNGKQYFANPQTNQVFDQNGNPVGTASVSQGTQGTDTSNLAIGQQVSLEMNGTTVTGTVSRYTAEGYMAISLPTGEEIAYDPKTQQIVPSNFGGVPTGTFI